MIIAGLIILLLGLVVLWINIIARREKTRRAMLPPQVRKALDDEDAADMQRFTF